LIVHQLLHSTSQFFWRFVDSLQHDIRRVVQHSFFSSVERFLPVHGGLLDKKNVFEFFFSAIIKNGDLNGNECTTENITCGSGTRRESRPSGTFYVATTPPTTLQSELTCGPGTANVNNECVIQFGPQLEINQPHVCRPNTNGSWSGEVHNLQGLTQIPSSVQVSIGGFDCTPATRQNNQCQINPSHPTCSSVS
tara:strand:+ start:8205 stop:8786 length:582 start_codon:yes stop_codon:yes gene_type:complete